MSGTELIRTKLAPPLVGGSLVNRGKLLQRLHGGLNHLLTLVVAPAGFGKTTLLAEWRSALAEKGLPSAWVTLDPDDDLAQFGAYVLAALAEAYDGVGRRAQELVRNDPLVPAKEVVAVLINEIAEARRPIVLILDDLDQVIAEPVHATLFRLLRHGPENFHVALAGRGEPRLPLSHFQSRNQLLRQNVDDLRFNPEDARHFFHNIAGLDLNSTDLHTLWQATEGWVTGLQLAAIALENRGSTLGVEAGLAAAQDEISQYLTENVLAALPDRLADFLLRISLVDRISPGLATALTGCDDAADLLEQLEQRNLFLAPLNAARDWYRFHALFADYLRARALRQFPGGIPALHRKASAWLAANEFWLEAVKHALAGGDESAAATWVEHCAMDLIEQSDLRTLRTWLGRLPEHVIHSRLRLRLAQTWCYCLGLRPQEAVAMLQGIQDDLDRGTL